MAMLAFFFDCGLIKGILTYISYNSIQAGNTDSMMGAKNMASTTTR